MSRETCLGCPIEECHVEVDGLCNRCDDIEDWLAEHDKQIRDEVIDEFALALKNNSDVYSGQCSCRHSVSLDKIFEIAKKMKGEQNND